MTCPGRETFANYVIERIPNLIISYDNFTDPGKFKNTSYKNAQKAWKLAGEEACVQLEDDIILCNNFITKIEKAISERPNDVIQFFSMRKTDLTIGSRWDAGRNYLMAQCTYFPAKISSGILSFSKKYDNIGHKSHPLDSMVADYLASTKQKYWINCPSLVDHIVGKSMIDPRRASTNRQSFTFVK